MTLTKGNEKINEGAINSDWERIGVSWIWAQCDGVK